jgi:hypothetical protein
LKNYLTEFERTFSTPAHPRRPKEEFVDSFSTYDLARKRALPSDNEEKANRNCRYNPTWIKFLYLWKKLRDDWKGRSFRPKRWKGT